MAAEIDPPEFQDETKRLLGRCLLRLQQYERLIKALYASHDLSGRPHDLVDVAAKRVSDVSEQTLGQLIGKLSGSFLTGAEEERAIESADTEVDEAYVRFKVSIQMSPEDYLATILGLKELVSLRNRLVHNFIDNHDLWSEAGCTKAEEYLRTTFSIIDNHFGQLRKWATHIDNARRLALEQLQSKTASDYLMFGIRPDGTIDWEAAPVVHRLREAFDQFHRNGWARIDVAQEWLEAGDHEVSPKRYLCSSWRHLIHECRQFDLQYFTVGERRIACYRPRASIHRH